MQSGNTADAILAQLATAGVKRIYGVVGDAIFPLAGALARQSAIRFVPAMHEASAAFMASYEAKLTGALGVCSATSGPGVTNLASGLADAFSDGASVLAITGQVELCRIGTDAAQYFHQQSFLQPITSFSELALTGESALRALLSAIHVAVATQTPTHIAIPKDVFTQPLSWQPLPLQVPPGAGVQHSLQVGDWQRTLEQLLAAKRPVVLVGTCDPPVVEEALSLARALGAAVVTAQQAKGSVPSTCEQLVGGIGEAHVPPMLAQADFLLLIGVAPYEQDFIPAIPTVTIGRKLNLPAKPLLASFAGRPGHVIAALRQALQDRQGCPEWQEAIAQARRALNDQVQEMPDAGHCGNVDPYRLALALSEAVAPDAVVAVDTGAFTHWFDLGFRVRRQTILSSPLWRAMGAALPAAIAAALSTPLRQVVAVVGDGSLLMSLADIAAAVQLSLPVAIVVVGNASYDLERQKMKAEGFAPMGVDLIAPDFAAIAQACGARGVRVTGDDGLKDVLAQALEQATGDSIPVLIDIKAATPPLPHLAAQR